MKTITLAHYYTTPEVQGMADFVGDSLDLAIKAVEEKPDKIIFAGVKFMAETAKILNPDAEVILPDASSTCSLVEQTDITKLKEWRNKYSDHVHVAYINSSAEHKALADIIVTSRIVDDVIATIISQGKNVIFSPDYNMGLYLNLNYNYNMPLWSAVCEVHDKFSLAELNKVVQPGDFLIAHPESSFSILASADYVGSTHGMLAWIKEFKTNRRAVVWVATEEGLLYNMRQLRPDLDIRQAPVSYKGCQCNACPYMKANTVENVTSGKGLVIDYLTDKQLGAALIPLERMMHFQRTGEINV